MVRSHLVVHGAPLQVARAAPMVREFHAGCCPVGFPFEFFCDCSVKRTNALPEQLAIQYFLCQGMAKR